MKLVGSHGEEVRVRGRAQGGMRGGMHEAERETEDRRGTRGRAR